MLARILAVPAALVLSLAVVAGCGGDGDDDGRPEVVTSFYPLQFLVAEIAGDAVRVSTLTEPGAEPHELEPSINQVADIADATLVVYSAGLQPAVDAAVAENAKEGLDVAEDVDLTGDNPHFWLDPLRMKKAAAAIGARLSDLLPEEADTFAANLAALDTRLDELDRAFATGLSDCARDTIVTTHDAFGYWSRYGLEFAPIAGLSPDAEPSPAHLADLRDLIRAEGLTTVFSESIASPKLADALAGDLGLRTAVLDPVEGLRKGSSEDYVSLMEADLLALQEANDCVIEAG